MSVPTCRILCVDDHNDTSEMLKLLLSQENFEVATAMTIGEAIALSKEDPFDLYVLDKRLPDGSGLELCERLHVIAPNAVCIFYTGDAYEIHREQALKAGADAFVAKPDIEKLIKSVHQLLEKQECAAAVRS